jgi:hypothetical protein
VKESKKKIKYQQHDCKKEKLHRRHCKKAIVLELGSLLS